MEARHEHCNVQCSLGCPKKLFYSSIILAVESLVRMGDLSHQIFIDLSRDTPLAHIYRIWSDGHKAIYGQKWPNMAIWPYGHRTISKKSMGKWGIPGKIYKNVAQQC